MRLIQFVKQTNTTGVGIVNEDQIQVLRNISSTYELANLAIQHGTTLEKIAQQTEIDESISYTRLIEEKLLLPPVTHPDPAHMLVTGTGLTHLGSADARDQMHKVKKVEMTDSMRMFQQGLEGGKPEDGSVGVQPEWFYKGDGTWVVAPHQPLLRPAFAFDGGEEPEIVGIYIIGADGMPYRMGYALGNEFSDHVMEKQNYLYLAHSKLRTCSFGPELRLGQLPGNIQGAVRILRNEDVVWEKPFYSGEQNMSHSISNLEYHQFKYAGFRRPGDVHIHFFGTATLSFTDGIQILSDDIIEIDSSPFGKPLRNPVVWQDEVLYSIKTL